MNKEIMINGEKWIVDYGRRVISNNVKLDTGMLPINASIEYPFCMFKDTIYFQKGNNAYKITIDSDTAVKISAEELKEVYDEVLRLIRLTDSYIESIVNSMFIDKVFKDKCDVTFSITNNIVNGRFSRVFYQLKSKFPYLVQKKIKDMSRIIKALMPMYVDKSSLRKDINDIFQSTFEQEYIDDLVNKIYESNADNFERITCGMRSKKAK